MPHLFTTREPQTTDQYVSDLERRLRRGLSADKAAEVAGEVRAHLDDAMSEAALGATQTETERVVLQRFGTPARYARRILDSRYHDPLSRWGRRGAVALGTFLLLSAFLGFQSFQTFMQIFGFVGMHVRSLIVPLCSLFLVCAWLGKRAHVRLWVACGLVSLLVVGIDGGYRYVLGPYGPMTRLNPAYANWEKYPPKTDAVPLLLEGVRVYREPRPHVPPALREGSRFIVPRLLSDGDWRERDFNGIFRHKLHNERYRQIWDARRDAMEHQSWSDEGMKRYHDLEVQAEKELLQIASSAPYNTVTTAKEAAVRWRLDGPRHLDLLRRDKEHARQSKAAFDKAYQTPPGFHADVALAHLAQFWWVPCLIAVSEMIMAALGRIMWDRLRPRRLRGKAS